MAGDTFSGRLAERDVRDSRGRTAPRRSFDFLVNGEALGPRVQEAGFDNISRLWVDNATAAPEAEKAARRLLGQLAGDAPHSRVSVYGCAECGDLGCGAVTVALTVSEGTVTWTDWSYQTNYEDEVHDVDGIRGLRDFVFDRREYEHALSAAVARIGQLP